MNLVASLQYLLFLVSCGRCYQPQPSPPDATFGLEGDADDEPLFFSGVVIDQQNNIYSHHAEGLSTELLGQLQQKDTAVAEDLMSSILPAAINLPLTEGYKSNLTTSKQIATLAEESKEHFGGTYGDIGGAYIKFLCMTVGKWKEVHSSMDKAGCEYRVLSRNIIKNIIRHGIYEDDSAEFTMSYTGEYHAQSFEKRMNQKYPPKMYAFAKAGNVEIVEIKIAATAPFDRDGSLNVEAFVAALYQQATINSFGAGGDTDGYTMQSKEGESFNSVIGGHRPLILDMSGNALNVFFRRVYNKHGHVRVADYKDDFYDVRALRSFVENHDGVIRDYNKLSADQPILIMHAAKGFGHIVGTRNVELGRGLFNEERIEEMREKKQKCYLARLEDMKLEGLTSSRRYSFVDGKVIPKDISSICKDLYLYFREIRKSNDDDEEKTAAFATYRSDQKAFFELNGYGYLVNQKEYDVVMKKITQNHLSNRAGGATPVANAGAPPRRAAPPARAPPKRHVATTINFAQRPKKR